MGYGEVPPIMLPFLSNDFSCRAEAVQIFHIQATKRCFSACVCVCVCGVSVLVCGFVDWVWVKRATCWGSDVATWHKLIFSLNSGFVSFLPFFLPAPFPCADIRTWWHQTGGGRLRGSASYSAAWPTRTTGQPGQGWSRRPRWQQGRGGRAWGAWLAGSSWPGRFAR